MTASHPTSGPMYPRIVLPQMQGGSTPQRGHPVQGMSLDALQREADQLHAWLAASGPSGARRPQEISPIKAPSVAGTPVVAKPKAATAAIRTIVSPRSPALQRQSQSTTPYRQWPRVVGPIHLHQLQEPVQQLSHSSLQAVQVQQQQQPQPLHQRQLFQVPAGSHRPQSVEVVPGKQSLSSTPAVSSTPRKYRNDIAAPPAEPIGRAAGYPHAAQVQIANEVRMSTRSPINTNGSEPLAMPGDVEAFESRLRHAEAAAESARNRLEAQRSQSTEELSSLRSELAASRVAWASQRADLTRLKEELEAKNAELLGELEAARSAEQNEIEQQEAALQGQHNEERERLESDVSALRLELAQQKMKNEALERSRSEAATEAQRVVLETLQKTASDLQREHRSELFERSQLQQRLVEEERAAEEEAALRKAGSGGPTAQAVVRLRSELSTLRHRYVRTQERCEALAAEEQHLSETSTGTRLQREEAMIEREADEKFVKQELQLSRLGEELRELRHELQAQQQQQQQQQQLPEVRGGESRGQGLEEEAMVEDLRYRLAQSRMTVSQLEAALAANLEA